MTELLKAWHLGDTTVLDRLFDQVYGELMILARSRMMLESPGHTWRPTELVHEVFIRLAGGGEPNWQSRQFFFAAAAQAMRRILVEHARSKNAVKRGAGWRKSQQPFDVSHELSGGFQILAIDEALNELEKVDARKAKLVELRFFSGLAMPEVAEMLGISLATAKRDWAFAKAWLYGKLRDSHDNAG